MEQHNDRVQKVAKDVNRFWVDKKPFRQYHGSKYSTRPSQRQCDAIADISSLIHVLVIDATK